MPLTPPVRLHQQSRGSAGDPWLEGQARLGRRATCSPGWPFQVRHERRVSVFCTLAANSDHRAAPSPRQPAGPVHQVSCFDAFYASSTPGGMAQLLSCSSSPEIIQHHPVAPTRLRPALAFPLRLRRGHLDPRTHVLLVLSGEHGAKRPVRRRVN
ncbi:uncharacterized protein K452DRAFT_5504 [Aplosporella prunicola CBS 121167]|uniref:Uncharacterized protein n=1 Tax=Aplosporella prunicola CBS 121167 TaxID=1176127 RepID=A0A6A6BX69_9PEZI|nr:uncharacterized protein K452DRAFT_5504 [Aplosporella prunicola CBS 121167]KAF2147321.1 hypothetical protein K452DRAFT_5504 [Aplosporella prunicola CBS 121167]